MYNQNDVFLENFYGVFAEKRKTLKLYLTEHCLQGSRGHMTLNGSGQNLYLRYICFISPCFVGKWWRGETRYLVPLRYVVLYHSAEPMTVNLSYATLSRYAVYFYCGSCFHAAATHVRVCVLGYVVYTCMFNGSGGT